MPEAAVGVAAGNRAAAVDVRVVQDRQNTAGRGPANTTVEVGIANHPFHDAPAIVAAKGDDVDLFAGGLPDIAANQLSGGPVKGPAPRVAQTIRIDFVRARDRTEERVRRRRR